MERSEWNSESKTRSDVKSVVGWGGDKTLDEGQTVLRKQSRRIQSSKRQPTEWAQEQYL